MNNYLCSIGFGQMKELEVISIIEDALKNHLYPIELYHETEDIIYARISVAKDAGLSVIGIVDSDNNIARIDSITPYYLGNTRYKCKDMFVQMHSYNRSYGIIFDGNLSEINILCALENAHLYENIIKKGSVTSTFDICLMGFAKSATVILPVDEGGGYSSKLDYDYFIDSLTEEMPIDYDGVMSKRAVYMQELSSLIVEGAKEKDLMSVIATFFQPTGVECDIYTILGTIEAVHMQENKFTGLRFWHMEINANGYNFDICVGEKELLGVPGPGRRIKADIWLSCRILNKMEKKL